MNQKYVFYTLLILIIFNIKTGEGVSGLDIIDFWVYRGGRCYLHLTC